jgi:hypothetical protein
MNDEYKPRFSFEITDEQKERADRLITTYGLRKAMFGQVLDDILDLIDEYGGVVIGIIASSKLKPREIIPSLKKAEEVGKHGNNR